MNRFFSFFVFVLFLSFQNYSFAQNCPAGTATAFEDCANNNTSGTIDVSNNSNYTVNGAVDISNMEVDLGNADIILNPNIIVDAQTTFTGNGSASFVVNGVVVNFNTSPTFQEINDLLATGNYTTLGQVASAILPVTLVLFKADLTDAGIRLFWQTASEINNEKFEIQKSENGRDWIAIADIAGAGTVVEKVNYEFIDDSPEKGLNYFRLKQIDFDGGYEFSKSIVVDFGVSEAKIAIYPNPVSDVLNIELSKDFELTTIQIFNQVGKIVFSTTEFDSEKIDISDLPKGVYFLRIQSNRTHRTMKFLIE